MPKGQTNDDDEDVEDDEHAGVDASTAFEDMGFDIDTDMTNSALVPFFSSLSSFAWSSFTAPSTFPISCL